MSGALKSSLPPLYRLPNLLSSDSSTTVCFVEGEKCVHALEALGLVATTTLGGANRANDTKDFSALRGRNVVILPDKDEAGTSYAEAFKGLCKAAGAHVNICSLPGLRKGQHDLSQAT